ncbi:MAG: peroxiredoxin [Desulfobacterales bacterium]
MKAGNGWIWVVFLVLAIPFAATAQQAGVSGRMYDPGQLKPIDSRLKLKAGDEAPDFTLPSISGRRITLSDYRGRKNVVLSFVPAAWTPVCSDQWPGYNLVKDLFDLNDTVILGITVDNVPTLFAWTREMGELWFEVLSDFWPHGAVADRYGVLRTDGMSERAMIFVDKKGVVRTTMVTDINRRPDLEACIEAIEEMNRE